MTIHIHNILIILLLASFSYTTTAKDASRGPFRTSYVFMTAHNKRTGEKSQTCVNYQQYSKDDTPTSLVAEDFDSARPLLFKFWKGMVNLFKICPLPPSMGGLQIYTDGIVPLDYRIEGSGPCERRFEGDKNFRNASQFTVDTLKEHRANASLLILDRGRQFVQSWRDYLFSEFYDPYINNAGAIPTFFIYRSDLMDKILPITTPDDISGDAVEIRFHRPSGGRFDPSFFIIWFISMTCVAGGGLWAFHRHRAGKDAHLTSQQDDVSTDNGSDVKGFFEKYGNGITIALMMIILCGVLLLGYFFRPVLVYFFNVFLVIFGTCSLYGCIRGFFSNFPIVNHRWYNAKMDWFPLCCGRTNQYKYSEAFIGLLCLSFCVTWFFMRRNPYAFVLLDIINMALCLHVLKCLRLPSLKWISILMGCMFFYDAVMVFGTPYITPNGCSIMLEVATGLNCAAKGKGKGYPIPPIEQDDIPEKFPMLMQVPQMNPMNECLDMAVELGYQFTILGLGDIVMPGYLVSHCFTMNGFSERVRLLYGLISVTGYGIGLVVTFVALTLMKTAQPALIYLVPSTLLPIICVAFCRGEFGKIWDGVPADCTPLITNNSSPDSTMDEVPANLIVNQEDSTSPSSNRENEPVNV